MSIGLVLLISPFAYAAIHGALKPEKDSSTPSNKFAYLAGRCQDGVNNFDQRRAEYEQQSQKVLDQDKKDLADLKSWVSQGQATLDANYSSLPASALTSSNSLTTSMQAEQDSFKLESQQKLDSLNAQVKKHMTEGQQASDAITDGRTRLQSCVTSADSGHTFSDSEAADLEGVINKSAAPIRLY